MNNINELPRLTQKENAVEIRAALKRAFPSTKFRVRCERGGSIRVYWTDGPTSWQANLVVKQFEDRGFDGMSDSNYSHNRVITRADGTKARPSFDFVFTNRSYTPALLRNVLNYLVASGHEFARNVNITTESDGRAYFSFGAFSYHDERLLSIARSDMHGNGLIMRAKS